MRILIADHDAGLTEKLKCDFAQRNHSTEIAADAPESLAKLKDFLPNVLVIEGGLPPDGCEDVLSSMWEDPSLSHIPAVILMAANDTRFDGLRNRNAVAWLQKPFEFDDLLQKIQAANQSSSASVSNGDPQIEA